jgi:hypothetical protein
MVVSCAVTCHNGSTKGNCDLNDVTGGRQPALAFSDAGAMAQRTSFAALKYKLHCDIMDGTKLVGMLAQASSWQQRFLQVRPTITCRHSSFLAFVGRAILIQQGQTVRLQHLSSSWR